MPYGKGTYGTKKGRPPKKESSGSIKSKSGKKVSLKEARQDRSNRKAVASVTGGGTIKSKSGKTAATSVGLSTRVDNTMKHASNVLSSPREEAGKNFFSEGRVTASRERKGKKWMLSND